MHNIEAIDKLLITELGAAATYRQMFEAFRKDGNFTEMAPLIAIYRGHKNAISDLQAQIRELGGKPADHSGVWQAWVKRVQGANRLTTQAALDILQQGEKHAAECYLQVLRNAELPLSIRCLIEWKLLLIQISHTRILDRLVPADIG
ncbi:DUF2383 domain-containing protein [Methylomonas sp. HW2-6]|uniref:DUF2383 domain-containing protein n=1 Tax=Methylomonas TaxID=416 RepID=UPI0011270CBD|nr:DUF2383 domain-containing protein [Methylomonas koyamae]TPQ24309.1 hypothetical protein C2U68_20395 [Methylomonas koyamae]